MNKKLFPTDSEHKIFRDAMKKFNSWDSSKREEFIKSLNTGYNAGFYAKKEVVATKENGDELIFQFGFMMFDGNLTRLVIKKMIDTNIILDNNIFGE